MRKRSEREKSRVLPAALVAFLGDFLDIADNFDRALEHAGPRSWRDDFGQGVELIRQQFAELWKRYGLNEVDTSGAFDPNVHEAVATEATDEVPPQHHPARYCRRVTCSQDRLVRPALVKVAVRESEEPAQKGEAG